MKILYERKIYFLVFVSIISFCFNDCFAPKSTAPKSTKKKGIRLGRVARGTAETIADGAEAIIAADLRLVKEMRRENKKYNEELSRCGAGNKSRKRLLEEKIEHNELEIRKAEARMRDKGEKWDNLAFGVVGGLSKAFIGELEEETKRRTIERQEEIKAESALKAAKYRTDKLFEFLSSPKKIGVTILGVGASALLISGAYFGGRIMLRYAEKVMGQPKIVLDTNIPTFKERIFGRKRPEASRLKEFVPPPGIEEEVTRIANTIKRKVEKGRLLTNVLFYGPPGTGKTMYAKELAKKADAYFDYISGANFSQFAEGDDVTNLNRFFDSREWVTQRDKRPVIVFIDEADAFLRDRRSPETSERIRRLVNTFLSRVEKPSSKYIMFIFATNHPGVLDPAVWSRIGNKIEFKLPALEQRKQLILVYLKKHVIDFGIKVGEELKLDIIASAERIGGFSARDIEQMMVDLQTAADEVGTNMLNANIVSSVVSKKIAEHQLAEQIEAQKQDEQGYHGLAGATGGLQLQLLSSAENAVT
jgi:ATPase family AAA domain-containing protein 3A/B